ncbi:GNAT family N-acetyltransferase [Haloarchaeobius sp. DFWS5]|uniref:GNAT family N-acetyltransferase n=1 Tax=Haloarchaeobius sp. DFWS5 TaxID=3446114 RepID=UPI003EBB2E39
MNVEQITLDEWSNELPEEGVEIFHSPDVLAVADKYTDSELRLFGGFSGQELVGFLPVFVREYPAVTVVLSPPPAVSLWRMGPVIMPQSPKRRKKESLNRKFIDGALQKIGADKPLTLSYIILSTSYTDPRPYKWADYDFEPRFTYRLDLQSTDEEEVLSSFSRSLRSEIKYFDDVPVDVTVGSAEEALRVYDEFRKRFAEQGASFPTSRAYTRDLVATLGDRASVYTAEGPDGEFLGGITVLYSNTCAYFWQGGMRSNFQGRSVNSLLHWRIIQDILSDSSIDSVTHYDLGRAAVERLGQYKSKFNPDIVPYYEIKSGKLISIAKEAYKFIAY